MTKAKKLGFFTHGIIPHVYSSKLHISKILDFSNAYQWHKYLWKFFPDCANEKRSFLFRWDNGCQKSIVYLLSKRKPKNLPPFGNWTTKEVLFSFKVGDFFSFQIRVNPVKITCPEGKNSSKRKRVPLVEDKQILSWFEQKSLLHGFKIIREKIHLENPPPIFCHKLHSGKSFHHNVNISGILQVTEEERFLHALTQGIGRGKSLGFGLLLL